MNKMEVYIQYVQRMKRSISSPIVKPHPQIKEPNNKEEELLDMDLKELLSSDFEVSDHLCIITNEDRK